MTERHKQPLHSAIARILDANLDRAREGLRVVEEWCRFGLNQADLTEQCKTLRQTLAVWHTADLRAARDTPGDPGTSLTHPGEETRADVSQVVQANLCRVQEALRVLEEYAKVDRPAMATACKQLRYQAYTLESQLMQIMQSQLMQGDRRQKLQAARLYLVTSPSEQIVPVVEAALQGGLTLVQHRDKHADDGDRLAIAQQLCDLCHRYGALFIVNDRVDIALAVGADGVHLGQQDIPFAVARQLLGEQRLIGRSTKHPDELHRAIAEGADYIGVGPVYETPTKAGRAAVGLEYVQYAVAHAPMPWFAIGGIDLTNVQDVVEAGASRVAVVRAIMESTQPTQDTQTLLSQVRQSG